ncbi:MAG: phosphatase PAP2 family protein [Pseudomonadota bacterium]
MDPFVIWLQQALGSDIMPVMKFVTDWGGPVGWYIAIGVFLIFAGISRGMPLVVLAFGSLLLNTWLKWAFVAPRPFYIDPQVIAHTPTPGFGMPSGHAQGAFAVWGGLGMLLKSRFWCIALFGLAALVALTRPYLGVHSLGQIVVGATLAIIAIGITLRFWGKVTSYLNEMPSGRLWLLLGAGALVATLLNILILQARSDFVVPQQWVKSYAAAAGLEHATTDDLGLFADGGSLMIAMLTGFLAMALVARAQPAQLTRSAAKWIALVVAIIAHVAVIALVAQAGMAQIWLYPVLGAIPTLCLYLPMRLADKLAR